MKSLTPVTHTTSFFLFFGCSVILLLKLEILIEEVCLFVNVSFWGFGVVIINGIRVNLLSGIRSVKNSLKKFVFVSTFDDRSEFYWCNVLEYQWEACDSVNNSMGGNGVCTNTLGSVYGDHGKRDRCCLVEMRDAELRDRIVERRERVSLCFFLIKSLFSLLLTHVSRQKANTFNSVYLRFKMATCWFFSKGTEGTKYNLLYVSFALKENVLQMCKNRKRTMHNLIFLNL